MSQGNKKSKLGNFFKTVALVGVGVVGGLLASSVFNKKQSSSSSTQQQQQQTIQRTDVQNHDNFEQTMICPISLQIMKQPCSIMRCGHIFEKQKIKQWVNKFHNCPNCKIQAQQNDIIPSYTTKNIIDHYQKIRRENQKNIQETKRKQQVSSLSSKSK